MITTAGSVILNGHNSPGQNLTAPAQLTQLGSTLEVVTGSKWLQMLYHNIALRKCPKKPNVNPICEDWRRVGWEVESGGKARGYIEQNARDPLRWRTARKAAFWQLVKTLSDTIAVAGNWTAIKKDVKLVFCDSCGKVACFFTDYNKLPCFLNCSIVPF